VPICICLVLNFSGACEELSYWAFLHFSAALDVLKPDVLFHHHICEPYGQYWDAIKHRLTLQRIDDFSRIFDRPIAEPAHKSDIMRLRAVLKHGGVLPVRSFDPLLRTGRLIRGVELHLDLGSSVIVAPVEHRFLREWLNDYVTFDDTDWAGHAIHRPSERAWADEELCILHKAAFFKFEHLPDSLDKLYSTGGSESTDGVFAVHLYNHVAAAYLGNLTGPQVIKRSAHMLEYFSIYAYCNCLQSA
jgi:hypothetical protein